MATDANEDNQEKKYSRYWVCQNLVLASQLTRPEKLLLLVIFDYTGEEETGECTVENEQLAKDMGLRRVTDLITSLVEAGIISNCRQQNNRQQNNRMVRRINWLTVLRSVNVDNDRFKYKNGRLKKDILREFGVRLPEKSIKREEWSLNKSTFVDTENPAPLPQKSGTPYTENSAPLPRKSGVLSTENSESSPPEIRRSINNIHSTSIKHPPPPEDSPQDNDQRSWVQEVEEELIELGIDDLRCLQQAIDAGLIEPAIRELLRHYREHQQRLGWSPKALHYRLRTAKTSMPSDRGWPQPGADAARQQQQSEQERRRQREQAQRQLQQTKQQLSNAAAAQAMQEREERFGGELDGMTEDEVRDLARSISPDLAKRLQSVRGNRNARSVRRALLLKIENIHSGHGMATMQLEHSRD